MNNVVPLLVAVPLAVAFLLPLVSRNSRRVAETLVCLTMLGLFCASWSLLGQEFVYHVGNWAPPLGIDLRVDALTTLMLLTINGLAFVISVYAVSYMPDDSALYRFYSLFLFVIAGLNGVVVTGDLFNLYVFVEITAIASYALVAYGGKHEHLEASFKYAVLGGLSSSAILIGIALTYAMTGTVNMAHLASRFSEIGTTGPLRIAMALFFTGFGLKAALVPFHAWLPDAYPASPAPISALLSGVVSKAAGLYVLVRLLFNVFGVTEETLLILRCLGGITMVIGGVMAFGQWDLKRLLAYSSMSQVGLIVLAFGLGTAWGVVGALFHFVNHATFKPLLFLGSGQVEAVAGTRDMRAMSGLGRALPVTSATSLVGSLALAGVPPFNGFWSKLIIVAAAVEADHTLLAILVVVMSIVTLAYQFKAQKAVFSSGLDSSPEQSAAKQESLLVALPMLLLAAGCVALSLLAISGLKQPLLVWPAAEALMRGVFTW